MEEFETSASSPTIKSNLSFSEFSFQDKVKFVLSIFRSSLPLIISIECVPIANMMNLFWFREYEDSDIIVGSFGLGFVWATFWVVSLIFSLNQGLTVLVSHAFGAKNFKLCSTYLQRGVIILAMFSIPSTILLWFSSDVMKLVGVDPILAEKSKDYIRWIILSQIGTSLYDSMKSFMVAQKVFDPVVYIQIITISLHAVWSYIFIHVLGLGVMGAGICRLIEEWSNCILIYLYIKKSGKFEKTFLPWRQDSANSTEIIKQLKFTVPIAGVTYFEFIYFDFMMIVAGMFGTTQIVAHLAVAQTSNFIYGCYLAISITVMSLIGNALGARDLIAAKNYFKGGLFATLSWCLGAGIPLLIFRHEWITFWTVNPEITGVVLTVIVCYIVGLMPIDALLNAFVALLKATEKQDVINRWTLIGLYAIGLPLTLIVSFWMDFKVPGMWISFIFACSIILIVLVKEGQKLNWEEAMESIHTRIKATDKNKEIELNETESSLL